MLNMFTAFTTMVKKQNWTQVQSAVVKMDTVYDTATWRRAEGKDLSRCALHALSAPRTRVTHKS